MLLCRPLEMDRMWVIEFVGKNWLVVTFWVQIPSLDNIWMWYLFKGPAVRDFIRVLPFLSPSTFPHWEIPFRWKHFPARPTKQPILEPNKICQSNDFSNDNPRKSPVGNVPCNGQRSWSSVTTSLPSPASVWWQHHQWRCPRVFLFQITISRASNLSRVQWVISCTGSGSPGGGDYWQ